MNSIINNQRQIFQEQGYLIIRNAFSTDRVQLLADAVNRFLDRALAGEFTVPLKWVDKERRIPARVGNLLTPEEYDPILGEWFDADILPIVEAILEAPVRCSWLSLLTSGGGHPYLTIWHRDYCDVDHPSEAAVLERDLLRQCSCQAPLLPGDRFLQIVPGSHARPVTKAEVETYRDNPHGNMPGQLTIELEPGDIVFRHAHTLHRGWNPEGKLRQTLLAGFWRADTPVWQEDSDDRQAMLTPGHVDRMPPRMRAGVQRYLEAFPQGKPRSVKEI
ncbi:phytanoyl-CoA dioxygenase family protein [Candidatus Poribacteria bacterium]|nr:phytanoyl-CoA dioxygenase family protein [Candidatus Poribacteria bacterium]